MENLRKRLKHSVSCDYKILQMEWKLSTITPDIQKDIKYVLKYRDHSGYGLHQWEVALQCNAYSHWRSPYPEWSLKYAIFQEWLNSIIRVLLATVEKSFLPVLDITISEESRTAFRDKLALLGLSAQILWYTLIADPAITVAWTRAWNKSFTGTYFTNDFFSQSSFMTTVKKISHYLTH